MGDIDPNSSSPSSPPVPAHHRRPATLPVPTPTASFWQSSAPSPLAQHRSTPELPPAVDVVVVGSGITAAFFVREFLLQQPKLSILVLEARTLCSAATGRNGGHLIPSMFGQERDLVRWEVRNCEDVEGVVRAEGLEGECEFRRVQGVLAWCDRGMWEGAKRLVDASGAREEGEVQVVEGEEALGALGLKVGGPKTGDDGVVGATVQRWAATLSPYRLVCGLWGRVLGESVNLQTTTPVTRIEKGGRGWDVSTPRGTVRAKHVVVATNGYTSRLLERFTGVIIPTLGQMTALSAPKEWEDGGRMLKYDYGFHGLKGQDAVMSDYLVQRPWRDGGHFMHGGGRQWVKGGAEGCSDDGLNDPDAVSHLRQLPARLEFEGVKKELRLEAAWTGVMGYSKDDCPWVGGVPRMDGVWVAAGYTGHGMPNAPGCGRHVARLVAEALNDGDWRRREELAVERDEIPKEFVLDEERLARWELKR
ncbi:uncharacterized protein HMPREF1541_10833 [Cyphellophora europaea CBS 101466]|uniref:FAD dependent oxidoreductase domain-containing protein n=1 Tax=Cyphellophora europaea (strain CBS 101466) TaxID=1220924 RepID=W2S7F6_CYPE1|nr:uncharacterized protein HMPREF1541_10833 [Cyphellophora europaea CBS 101466]ETN43968.1 hypothetical protein HMPREF1541_10833 [Cyphellophora europaea CBS 101466]